MIRLFRKSDRDEINEILKENQYYKIEELGNNPYRNCFVLEENEIKGLLIYDEIFERFELVYIAVLKKERRKGYASLLMLYFLDEVKEKCGKNITLEVNVENKGAIEFYKKWDFEIISKRKKYYKNEDGYLMIRKM